MSAPSPALENLKKQAKYLLKRHREGYYPVCQRIRDGAARFRGIPDKAILARKLALHEAQEIVAKENGFD